MSNAKALAIVLKLLTDNKISISDALELAGAISVIEDTADAEDIRTHIDAISDFNGIVLKGRPRAPKVKGSDIITGSLTVRELEGALRLYWKGRKRNNAEMGRLMAVLEDVGCINVPGGGIEATVRYFISRVNYIAGWDVYQIRRGYSEVRDLGPTSFGSAVHKERLRVENCLRKLKTQKKCTLNRLFQHI